MKLKPGSRLRSQVDATEIIVVRAPADGDIEVACGGHPMIDVHDEPAPGLSPAGGAGDGTKIGKRYVLDGDAALEFLVTKAGGYDLSADESPLVLKEAKPLPASD
ncbi:MAG TPA: hypothetical protein VGG75_29415 [Trebonia sp.]|jgi:hypothetical protein